MRVAPNTFIVLDFGSARNGSKGRNTPHVPQHTRFVRVPSYVFVVWDGLVPGRYLEADRTL